MGHSELGRLVVVTLQHLCDHHLRERVFVDAGRTLVNEYIVVYLCEALYAVLKGDGRVQAKQRQVEVTPGDIF